MRGAELIKKYIISGLSNEERFELEKLALDDDFLADAWEGLNGPHSQNSAEIINKLNSKLSLSRQTKVVPIYQKIWPYAVAASLALIFIVTFLINEDNQKVASDQPMAIIVGEEEIEAEDRIAFIPSAETTQAQQINDHIVDVSAPKNSGTPDIVKKGDDGIPDAPITEKLMTRDDASDASLTDNSKMQLEEEVISSDQLPDQDKVQLVAREEVTKDSEAQSLTNAVVQSGVIHEPEVKPETNANEKITAPNEDIAFTDTKSARQKGLALKRVNVKDALSSFAQESEGHAPATLKSSSSAQVDQNLGDTVQAQPLIGFDEFRKIMSEHTDITKEELFMRGLRIPFLVTMRFTLNEEGLPENIEIMNMGQDPLQIRIINLFKHGGSWKGNGVQPVIYDFAVPVKK